MKNKGAGTTRDTIDRDAKTNTWIQQLQLTCRALKMRIKITNVLRNQIWFWRYNISCSRFSRCQNWKMIWQIVKIHTTFKNRPRQITTNYFQNSKNKLFVCLFGNWMNRGLICNAQWIPTNCEKQQKHATRIPLRHH